MLVEPRGVSRVATRSTLSAPFEWASGGTDASVHFVGCRDKTSSTVNHDLIIYLT